METATLSVYNRAAMENIVSADDTTPATDGEKFHFWQIAKKLCSEKRREQRKEAMKAYRQCLEPTIVPTEILWGGDNNGEGGETIDLGNLLLPPAKPNKEPTKEQSSSPDPDLSNLNLNSTLDDEEEGDADSCVSDVTRELPDIDADNLYPSLSCLDAELPDILVQEKSNKLEVEMTTPAVTNDNKEGETYHYKLPAGFDEPISVADIFGDKCKESDVNDNVLRNCKPNKSSLDQDSLYSNNSRAKYNLQKEQENAQMMEDMNNLLSQNMVNLTSSNYDNGNKPGLLRREPAGTSTPAAITSRSMPQCKRSTSNDSSLLPPRRRESRLSSSGALATPTMPLNKRTISEASPILPKRRGSLDSQSPQQQPPSLQRDWPAAARSIPRPATQVHRSASAASAPMPPQRRLSLDSRMDDVDNNTYVPSREELGYEDMSVYGRPQIHPKPSSKPASRDTSPKAPPRRPHQQTPSAPEDSDQNKDNKIGLKRTLTPPQRKESLDVGHHCHCIDDNHNTANRSGGSSGQSSSTQRWEPRTAQPLTPTKEELGYELELHDHFGDLPPKPTPRLPCRRNSFSSITSNDSTIATWTLGLYRRRKSADSTVAPAPPLSWGRSQQSAPDTTPSQPKRRFSAGSLMREQFAATESKWNCALSTEEDSRDNNNNNLNYFSVTTHTVSTLGLSSKGSLDRRGQRERRQPRIGSSSAQKQSHPRRHKSWDNDTPKKQPQQKDAPMELEIQPGLFLPLRGRKESLQAVEQNFVARTSCMSCETKLLCIQDAEYVLCPLCKVVSPVLTNLGSSGGGSVGLGIQTNNDPSLQSSGKRR